MKSQVVKTKHHYVWSYYLKNWSKNNKDIYYLTTKGKIALDSTKGLARENYFYKIGDIKSTDIPVLESFIKPCSEDIKKIHRDFFNNIYLTQLLTKEIKDDKHRIQLEKQLNSNTFENYLSEIEKNGKHFVDKLTNNEHIDFSVKENVFNLTYFLGHQFTRTKKIKDIISMADSSEIDSHTKEMFRDAFNRNWWFICSVLAVNVAKSLALDPKLKIQVIENKSSTKFITSDQPVVNIHEDGSNGNDIDLYYPLSPIKALIVGTSADRYSSEDEVNERQADELNRKLSTQASSTLYGESEEDIRRYKKYIQKQA